LTQTYITNLIRFYQTPVIINCLDYCEVSCMIDLLHHLRIEKEYHIVDSCNYCDSIPAADCW
jgi:hypothetical protein